MKKKLAVGALAVFAVLMTVLACVFYAQAHRSAEFPVRGFEKNTVQAGIFPAYTLEQAAAEADVIAVGVVTEKSAAVHEAFPVEGSANTLDEYYKTVTVETETVLKGGAGETVRYRENGGQFVTLNADGSADVTVYEYYGYPEAVGVGTRVVVFIKENGAVLSPDFLIPVDYKGRVTVPAALLAQGEGAVTVELGELLEEIKNVM